MLVWALPQGLPWAELLAAAAVVEPEAWGQAVLAVAVAARPAAAAAAAEGEEVPARALVLAAAAAAVVGAVCLPGGLASLPCWQGCGAKQGSSDDGGSHDISFANILGTRSRWCCFTPCKDRVAVLQTSEDRPTS